VRIPGCPPSPTALLQGILAAITVAAPPPPRIEPTIEPTIAKPESSQTL